MAEMSRQNTKAPRPPKPDRTLKAVSLGWDTAGKQHGELTVTPCERARPSTAEVFSQGEQIQAQFRAAVIAELTCLSWAEHVALTEVYRRPGIRQKELYDDLKEKGFEDPQRLILALDSSGLVFRNAEAYYPAPNKVAIILPELRTYADRDF
jgi:hypothetical protein